LDWDDLVGLDGWKPYSFSRRHGNYRDPQDVGFDEDGRPTPKLQKKLDAGLAFILDYFEHGNCLWSLARELPAGAQCPWDSVTGAGVVVWEYDENDLGAKTYEDRKKDARAFIDLFTMWCNGEVYYYDIQKPCGSCGAPDEDVDSCGGFIGADALFEALKEAIEEGQDVTFKGDAAGLADYLWPPKREESAA